MNYQCVKLIRPDLSVAICRECAGRENVNQISAEYESRGYSVQIGFCLDCVNKYKMDSLKGSHWVLPKN